MVIAETETTSPLVSIRGMSKTFGGTAALSDVSLDFRPGEIHALLGQNGSGKSTLVKILAGYHAPDHGSVIVRGEDVRLPIRAGEAAALGFSFVHQDLGLAENMSVLDNVRTGYFNTNWLGRIKWKNERRTVAAALAVLDVPVDPRTPVRDLPQAVRTLVAITRALQAHKDGKETLLVLDEPTAYLPRRDVLKLFEAMKKLAASGLAVVFVTHRLDEVKEVTDRASVLRDGKLIDTYDTDSTTERELITALIGRELGDLYPEPVRRNEKEVVLSLRGLCSQSVKDVGFDLHRGEVLGLTGLVGMGHDDLPYLICGSLKHQQMELEVEGQRYDALTPHRAIQVGIGLLPANRQRDSGVLAATIRENVTIPRLDHFFKNARLQHRLERNHVREILETFEVRPSGNPEMLLSSLSGGNQQKALLGKWMSLPNVRILLLHEPTQGVDIGSKQAIFRFIAEATKTGMAVLYVSAEYKDLAALCDRVLIMRGGQIRAELEGRDLVEERIVEQCYASSGTAVA